MRKKKRLILLLIFGVPVAGVVALLSLTMPLSMDKMEAVADRLQPGGEWVLDRTSISEPRILCLGGKCGGLHRVWDMDKTATLSEDSFLEIVRRAGYTENRVDCTVDTNSSGVVITKSCAWVGSYEGMYIEVHYSRPWDDDAGEKSTLRVVIDDER